MHAISPQVMVWDPTTPVGVPAAQVPDMQVMPPVMQPQMYCMQEAMPPIFTGATYAAPRDQQGGVVWVQHPPLVTQEEADMNQAFAQRQVSVQQPSLVPVLVTVNGHGVMMHQAVSHIPPPHARFCHISPDTAQNDGIHLVNINQRIQQGVRLTPVPQEQRQMGLLLPPFQEKHASPFDRPRLTPRRRHGTCYSAPGAIVNWRPSSDDRSLGGSNTAIRRRSQSADHDGNSDDAQHNASAGSPLPNKRSAPILTDFEKHDEFWRAPDLRILRKLIDIIEYYFSDECLSKNGYMLKQLSSGETDGYISLRRVAALKRVKAQTRDLRTVAHAVRQSVKLEMDEEGTMIRRKRPLPDNIEAPRFIRSVLAINLPKELPTVEDVTSLFTPYGELTQVRVLRPGKSIPSYLRDYSAWVPDLGSRFCAVVEFENQDEAQTACRDINMQNRGQNNLRVALLKPGARIRRTLYRKYKEEATEGGNIAENTNLKEDSKSETTEESTSSKTRPRCLSDSSYESNGNNVTSGPATADANSNNNNKPVTNFHYDASASNSDTDSDRSKSGKRRVLSKAKSEGDTHETSLNSGDSGYSRSSSSDERELVVSSNLTPNAPGGESGIASPGAKRSPPVQKKFIDGVPVGIERQPKGPIGDSKGFNDSRQAAD